MSPLSFSVILYRKHFLFLHPPSSIYTPALSTTLRIICLQSSSSILTVDGGSKFSRMTHFFFFQSIEKYVRKVQTSRSFHRFFVFRSIPPPRPPPAIHPFFLLQIRPLAPCHALLVDIFMFTRIFSFPLLFHLSTEHYGHNR
jgi:hypothetical protein